MRHAATIVAVIALAGCGELGGSSREDFESELTDSLADSLRSISDASSAANPGLGFAGGDLGGCNGVVTVVSQEPFCSVQHNARVHVAWTCVGPEGNGLTGTADIDTDLVPDACPPSSVDATQAITLDRQWTFGRVVATLTGTADLSWTSDSIGEPPQKTLGVALDHRVSRRGELLRHQLLTGSRTMTFDENVPGTDGDDARVVDGAVSVDFVLAGVTAETTETDLTYRRGCCHPLAGTIDFTLSGEETREGSIAFGPECGRAHTGDGRVLDLAPCSVD